VGWDAQFDVEVTSAIEMDIRLHLIMTEDCFRLRFSDDGCTMRGFGCNLEEGSPDGGAALTWSSSRKCLQSAVAAHTAAPG
jgi:hypothetical protein